MSGKIERSDIISDEALNEVEKVSAILCGLSSFRYRIVEYDGKFTIQKARTVTDESGSLWWKKIDKRIVWDNVNEYGNCTHYTHTRFGSFQFGGDPIDPLPSLKEAKAKIKVFQKGKTIHPVR